MQDSDLEGREGVLEGGERRDDSGLPLHIPDFTGQDIFLSKTQFLFAWETQFFVCVANFFFVFLSITKTTCLSPGAFKGGTTHLSPGAF